MCATDCQLGWVELDGMQSRESKMAIPISTCVVDFAYWPRPSLNSMASFPFICSLFPRNAVVSCINILAHVHSQNDGSIHQPTGYSARFSHVPITY